MNLIDQKFRTLIQQNQKAFIPFLTVGDPSLEASLEIILEMEKAGADLIELGVPYSDPLADGPVIQRSSERALTYHITILEVMELAKRARTRGAKIPYVLFTYYNPVLQIGIDEVFRNLQQSQISGIIIPDLPMEEAKELALLASDYDIKWIPLVAPTSQHRIHEIVQQASGFVYCVSSLGVTGERVDFHQQVDPFIQQVRASTSLPIVVGFGISNREQVKRFETLCDGVVVGSAIVKTIESVLPELKAHPHSPTALTQIHQFIANLKG